MSALPDPIGDQKCPDDPAVLTQDIFSRHPLVFLLSFSMQKWYTSCKFMMTGLAHCF